jgi:ubiquinone/menaquinone biosynthesis C-methylase UbiE
VVCQFVSLTLYHSHLQKRHTGGTSLVVGYPWDRFDTIIDVAGGVGTFTADLLASHPKLKAVVLDQQQQIARGKKVRGEPLLRSSAC